MKKDYAVDWVDLMKTPLHGKTKSELEKLKLEALGRAMDTQPGGPQREEANGLAMRIEAELARRSNRTMLWIAVVSLVVTGVTGLASLVLEIVRMMRGCSGYGTPRDHSTTARHERGFGAGMVESLPEKEER
ncbi:MAG: hypothetical protein ACLQIJ_01265 [Polyangia bacterium]